MTQVAAASAITVELVCLLIVALGVLAIIIGFLVLLVEAITDVVERWIERRQRSGGGAP